MFAKSVCRLIIGICFGAGGCGPCGPFKSLQEYPARPAGVAQQRLFDAHFRVVGGFDGNTSPGGLKFFLYLSVVLEPAGKATYSLEAYDREPSCLPEPGTPMTSYGNATDSETGSNAAVFLFSGQASSPLNDASSFVGKFLVLRAVHPELEPNASVACTPQLTASPAEPAGEICRD